MTPLAPARRHLVADSAPIAIGVAGYGLVFGLTAQSVGLSPLEAAAMSTLVFAGAAQLAAVGYLADGLGLVAILVLTAMLNARNLVYSAALAVSLAERSPARRALMAHFVSDEAFALAMAHRRRLGRPDDWGYWWAGTLATFVPWNVATVVGGVFGGAIPDPSRLGLDVVFPAAMAGIALRLAGDRRAVTAMVTGAASAVAVSLAWGPALGVMAGAFIGGLAALGVPAARHGAAG